MRIVLAFLFSLIATLALAVTLTPPEMILDFQLRPNKQFDFTNTLPGTITTSGGANGTAFNSGGVLIAATTPRLDYDYVTKKVVGTLNEPAATNVVLCNRDLTTATCASAWTVSNITAAHTQIGLDGVANSASSITATSANGTILQSITVGSTARFQTVYAKCITCAGALQMTMDNSTYTTLNSSNCQQGNGQYAVAANINTTNWVRCWVPTQTMTTMSVGFKIVSNGDSFIIDAVQNEVGTYGPTSPILTTTTSVARTADAISATIANAGINTPQGTVAMRVIMRYTCQPTVSIFEGASGGGGVDMDTTSGTTPSTCNFRPISLAGPNAWTCNFNGNSNGTFVQVPNVPITEVVSYGNQKPAFVVNGISLVNCATNATTAWGTSVYFGSRGGTSLIFTGWLVGFASYQRQMNNGAAIAISSPY